MPFITAIEPDAAHGELALLYEHIANARGGVADIHKVQSLNVPAMAAHLDLYKAVMFQPSPLPRAWREALAVAVSKANACEYCIAHHQAAFDQLGDDEVPQALLDWAVRLTRAPESASKADVDGLRALGLDDRAILDAVMAVGYFNYVNRLVLATGLTAEPGFEHTCGPDFRGES